MHDDDLADEQEEREAAQDETDEALSEPLTDPHAAEREALGFDLAWWDENETPPLDIVVDVANHVCGRTNFVRDLAQYGYDPSSQIAYVGLDSVAATLVVASLQILGVLHSHVRDEIAPLLKQIFDAMPEPDEETIAAFEQAAAAHVAGPLAGLGIEIVSMDELAERQAEIEDVERQQAKNRRAAELN